MLQEDFTTLSDNSGELPTTTLNGDVLTTTSSPDDQSTEPPQTSQVVAVSVSSSVVRQKPGSGSLLLKTNSYRTMCDNCHNAYLS